jgi:hypothetical protein
MVVTSRTRTLLFTTLAASLIVIGCSSGTQSKAPPRTGTLAHSWFAANVAWKAGEYDKAVDHLSRLAIAQSEYRDRARRWVLVAAAGVADGYRELADAYETGARNNKQVTSEYRKHAMQARNAANRLALLYAETIHDTLNQEKNLNFQFDFDFPTGSAAEPVQLTRITKGLQVQPADHELVMAAMATRGVVRFATALASPEGDVEKAKAQFANPPRNTALATTAKTLIGLADLYCNRKLDLPKRGNALCTEAEETIALLPADSKERKQLSTKLKEELKRFPVKS